MKRRLSSLLLFVSLFPSIKHDTPFYDSAFLGCYEEDLELKKFTTGGGSYFFNAIDIKQCLSECKRFEQSYAAFHLGLLCRCGSDISLLTSANETFCSSRCTGDATDFCGGAKNFFSVYATNNAVKNLQIIDPGIIQVFQPVTILSSLDNGEESSAYSFDWGDNVTSPDYLSTSQPHVYSSTGYFLIKLNASNDVSGPLETWKEVSVEAPISDLSTDCNPFVEVHFDIYCWASVGQGTNVEAIWNFGDDSPLLNVHFPDATRFTAGPYIPRYKNVFSLASVSDENGVFLSPSFEIKEEGKIEAWELYAVTEGQIKLQVYRPHCGVQEQYCAYNRSCMSRFQSCLPPSEFTCEGSTMSLCLKTGLCQPFEASFFLSPQNLTYNNVCLCNNTMEDGSPDLHLCHPFFENGSVVNGTCNNTLVLMENLTEVTAYHGNCSESVETASQHQAFRLVGEMVVVLEEGYNIITVNTSKRISVQPHDVIGYIPFRQKFPPYYREAAFPSIGKVGQSIGGEEAVTLFIPKGSFVSMKEITSNQAHVCSSTLLIKAHMSKQSKGEVFHSFSSSGLFDVSVSYNNPLSLTVVGPVKTIKSEYRILSIKGTHFTRDLGRYYACTDTPFELQAEITQGTFVRFFWEFPDGSHVLTHPYLTNNIKDGPGQKTPDSQFYHFKEIGNYTTTVKAFNELNAEVVVLETISRECIKGLTGFIVNDPYDNTTQDWNLAMAGTWLNFSSLITAGNAVEYRWEYGDKKTSGSWNPSTMYSHHYTSPGRYTVSVHSDNIASTLDFEFEVDIVKPATVHAPVYATSEIPLLIECDVIWHSGEELTFEWDFGDGSSLTVNSQETVYHNYSTYDTYTIYCAVTTFPAVHDSKDVIVQDPVEGVVLGNKTDIEATGDTVDFTVTWTRGNDVQFHWYFGGDEQDTVTNKPHVSHVYTHPGYYDLTVNVSNMVSFMVSQVVTIEIQERVTNLRVLSANSLICIGVPVSVSFDTGNKVKFDYHLGDNNSIVGSSLKEEIHNYQAPSLYTVTVYAFNAVSIVSSEALLLIDAKITAARLIVETPQIRTNKIEAVCWALNGSSVRISFDWGDGSAAGPFDATFAAIGSHYTGSHYYSAEGTYNITCFTENDYSRAVTSSVIILQEEITSLTFIPEVSVKGDIFDFTVLPFVGGSHDILFRWDYNDGMFYTTQEFTHNYVYRDAGMYNVKLTASNLVSELSVTQEIYIQEHIEGLFLSKIHPVIPGTATIITWQIEYGTDVEYTVDVGDETSEFVFYQSEVGNFKSLEYIYNYPGSYQVTVTSSNKLNSINLTDVAHVEYEINGLRSYIKGNSTTHTDKSSFVIIEIDRGTNVEYTCNFNDGSLPVVTTKQVCRHMFIDTGFHTVSVFAENHLSSSFTWTNASFEVILPPIPHQIRDLEIISDKATIFGEPSHFQMRRSKGNRFNCTWDFGDGSDEVLMDQRMVYWIFNHTYNDIGIFNVTLNCTNYFHLPVSAMICMVTQIPPSGLNFSSPLIGQYDQDLILTISLDSGTDVDSYVLFNNGKFTVSMVETNGVVKIPASFMNVTDWNIIEVFAMNMVPPRLYLKREIYVEAMITNLVMWTKTPYVPVGSVITFYATVDSGTDILLEWHLGSNYLVHQTIPNNRTSEIFSAQHLYVHEGLYAAVVIASNSIGQTSNIPLLIAVEDPVRGFSAGTDSPVVFPDGVVTFNVSLDWTVGSLPDNATLELIVDTSQDESITFELYSLPFIEKFRECKEMKEPRNWNEGFTWQSPTLENSITEGLTTERLTADISYSTLPASTLPAESDMPCSGDKSLEVLTLSHQYLPGIYQVEISVKNLASSQIFHFQVETQVPVSACSAVPLHGGQSQFGQPGGGHENNYFPLEHSVLFKANCTNATGVAYKWDFGDFQYAVEKRTTVEHTYGAPGHYFVTLVAENIFTSVTVTLDVYIQESIVGLYIGYSDTFSLSVSLLIFAMQPGTDAVYKLRVVNSNISEEVPIPVKDDLLRRRAVQSLDPNLHLPFNYSGAAVAVHSINLPYTSKWLVEVSGENYASSAKTHTKISISKEKCLLPQVNILGGGDFFNTPVAFKRYQRIQLVSTVTIRCPDTFEASLEWILYRVELYKGRLLPPTNSSTVDVPDTIFMSESTLTIPPYILDYGDYMVQMCVTVQNEEGVSNCQQTFIEVIPTDLIVMIEGGKEEMVSRYEAFWLNGSTSNDPGVDPADEDVSLVFKWYCHLGNETYNLEDQSGEGAGCFGHGPGFISNESKVLPVWPTNMTYFNKYIFTLVISKDGHQSKSATKVVLIEDKEVVQLTIGCRQNCGRRVNPLKPLILVAECPACKANLTDIKYHWNIEGLNTVTDAISISGFSDQYLAVQPKAVEEAYAFNVSLTAMFHGLDVIGLVEETFAIASPLQSGTCTVTPTNGTALLTKFSIFCSGFSSSETPITYQFLHCRRQPMEFEQQKDQCSLIFSSPDSKMPPKPLPAGEEVHNFSLSIQVLVTDAVGMTGTDELQIQVAPAESNFFHNQLVSLNSGNISIVDKAVGRGDVQEVSQLIGQLASYMNTHTSDRLPVKGSHVKANEQLYSSSQVRSDFVDTLSQISLLNIDLGRQAASALTEVIYEPNDVSVESQLKAADIYLSVVDEMEESGFDGINELALEELSSSLIQGSASLLKASLFTQAKAASETNLLSPSVTSPSPSQDPSVLSQVGLSWLWTPRFAAVYEGRDNETNQEQSLAEAMFQAKNVTSSVMTILNKVSEFLMKTHIPGQTAVTIDTDAVYLMLLKESLMPVQDIHYRMPDGSRFLVPGTVLQSLQTSSLEVIVQIISFTENPFTWHISSHSVATGVFGLSFWDLEGNSLSLSNLEERIEIFLPRGEHSALEFETKSAYTHEFMMLNFNVTERSSSIHIDIQPVTDEEVHLEAYIRFAFWPTMNDYDLKKRLPLPDSSVRTSVYNDTANFTTNPYTWFIPESRLYATGSYYLGVRVVGASSRVANESLWEDGIDVDVKIYTARCLYWSDEKQEWLPDGCQVGTLTTSSFTHCLCDHLTFFGGSFSLPPNQQLFHLKEEIEVINPIPSDSVFYIICALAGVGIVMVLTSLLMDCCVRRRQFADFICHGRVFILKVFTGLDYSAATTARVFVTFGGSSGSTEPIQLINEDGTAFQSGTTDTYLISPFASVGDIQSMTIWQDGKGFSPKWFLSRISLEDLQSGRQWFFICNSWLKKKNKAVILKTLQRKQRKGNLHLFAPPLLISDILKSSPLFKLFLRRKLSSSTHVEDAIILMAIVFGVVGAVTSVKEFLLPFQGEDIPTTKFVLDVDGALHGGMIGVASIFTFYMLLGLFSLIKPKVPKTSSWSKYEAEPVMASEDDNARLMNVKKISSHLEEVKVEIPSDPFDEAIENSEKFDEVNDDWDTASGTNENVNHNTKPENTESNSNNSHRDNSAGKRSRLTSSKLKRTDMAAMMKHHKSSRLKSVRFAECTGIKYPTQRSSYIVHCYEWWSILFSRHILPWGLSPVLCLLLIALCGLSGTFSWYFTRAYTTNECFRWISAFVCAIAIFLSSPMLVFCLSSIPLCFLRRPCSLMDASVQLEESDCLSVFKRETKSTIIDGGATKAKHFASFKSDSSSPLWCFVLQCAMKLIFLAAVMTSAYQLREPTDVYATKNLKDLFIGSEFPPGGLLFSKIVSPSDFWTWSSKVLHPVLKALATVSDDNVELNYHLLTVPRLRQLRIKDSVREECQNVTHNIPNMMCTSYLSSETEDSAQYTMNWHSPAMTDPPTRQRAGFRFSSHSEVPGVQFEGELGTYSTGGYIAELPAEALTIERVLSSLKENLWIDGATRGVFLEVALINPHINMTATVQLVLEKSPTGYLIPSINIHVMRLTSIDNIFHSCLVIFACYSVYCLMYNCLHMNRQGQMYFLNLGYLCGFCQMISYMFLCYNAFLAFLAFLELNILDESFGNFKVMENTISWYVMSLGLSLFFAVIDLLFILNSSSYFKFMGSKVQTTCMEMACSALFYLIGLFSVVWFSWTTLSSFLRQFNTHFSAIYSLLQMSLGCFISESWSHYPASAVSVVMVLQVLVGGFLSLLVFSTVAMQTYSASRLSLSIKFFLSSGKLNNLLKKLKTRLITSITLIKIRTRKKVLARKYRNWRNQQPVIRVFYRQLLKLHRRADILLSVANAKNVLLFENPPALIETVDKLWEDKKLDNNAN